MVRKAESKAVATQTDNPNTLTTQDVPDYLKEQKSTGLESLGQSDFKIPRIKLLQPLNPEVQSYQGEAIPGEFWHTAGKSLGSEFHFVPCLASKRVILWNPRDSGGGILAFSNDGIKWTSGGNQKFSVKIKNVKEAVTYDTKSDVRSSGLLEWGTANPNDDESGPAAQMHYEYLCYLPDFPDLSPVVMGVTRTSLANAKNFNTKLLMTRKPIESMLVRCFADEKSKGADTWWLHNFATLGYVPENLYKVTHAIAEKQKNYVAEYEQDDNTSSPIDNSY